MKVALEELYLTIWEFQIWWVFQVDVPTRGRCHSNFFLFHLLSSSQVLRTALDTQRQSSPSYLSPKVEFPQQGVKQDRGRQSSKAPWTLRRLCLGVFLFLVFSFFLECCLRQSAEDHTGGLLSGPSVISVPGHCRVFFVSPELRWKWSQAPWRLISPCCKDFDGLFRSQSSAFQSWMRPERWQAQPFRVLMMKLPPREVEWGIRN